MIIRNLGPIKNIDLKLDDATIFMGENGSGKTLISYLIYGILKFIEQENFSKIDNTKLLDAIAKNGEYVLNWPLYKSELRSDMANSINNNMKKILDQTFEPMNIDFSSTHVSVNEDDLLFLFKDDKDLYGPMGVLSRIDDQTLENIIKDTIFPLDEKTMEEGGLSFIKLSQHSELNEENMRFSYDFVLRFDVNNNPFESQKNSLYSQTKERILAQDEIQKLFKKKAFRNFVNSPVSFLARKFEEYIFEFELLYFPAERIGINAFSEQLFYEQLKDKNSENFIIEDFESHFSPSDVSNRKKDYFINYPLPIRSYISLLNNKKYLERARVTRRRRNFEENGNSNLNKFEKEVLRGSFELNVDDDIYYYTHFSSESDVSNKVNIMTASSSAKSLFAFDSIWSSQPTSPRKYHTKKIVFIDEPEMNLDSQAQVDFAKLLYHFSKSDGKLIISTHSELFIKTMLNELIRDRIAGFRGHMNIYSLSSSKPLLEEINFNGSYFNEIWEKIEDEFDELIYQNYSKNVNRNQKK